MRAFFLPLQSLQGRASGSAAANVSGRRLKEELPSLLVLGLIPAISSLGMSLHVPALNNMARCLSVDLFTAQSALSLYMLAFSVAIFASAFLADLVGKRRILLVSLSVSALASMLAAAASCFEVLLLARVLQAFAAGFIVVMPYAILQEMLSGRALSKTISFVSVLHSVAGATAPLLGGMFALGHGWRLAFALMSVYAIAMLICVHKSVRPSYIKRRKSPLPRELFSRARTLVFGKRFIACMALLSFISALYYGFLAVAPVMLITNLKFSEFHCGFALFVLCGFWPLGNRIASSWVDRFGMVRSFQLAALITCLGLIPLVFGPGGNGFVLITVAMIPYMIGAGIISPLVVALATRPDPGLSGMASSLMFSAQVFIGALTAWFFGFFDLSTCRDIGLFGLFMTMVSLVAIAIIFPPILNRTTLEGGKLRAG